MVKMIPLVCPNCGAKLNVKRGTQSCFCTYCGTQILISDNNNKFFTKNVNINQTSYDRTEIEKLKIQHEWESNKWKRDVKEVLAYIILMIVLLVSFYGLMMLFVSFI